MAAVNRPVNRPLLRIREKCLDCAGSFSAVKTCEFTDCSLYPYRFGNNPFRSNDKPTDYRPPLKAIRAECLSCNGNSEEVRLCPATGCALWPLRFGKPAQVSEARREAGKKSALAQKNANAAALKSQSVEAVVWV